MLGLHETSKVLDAIDSTKKSLEEAQSKEESASKRVAEAQDEIERFQRSLELVVATSIREGYEKALKRLGSHLARTSRTLIHFVPTDNLCTQPASHKHTPKRTSFLHLPRRTSDGAASTTIDAYSGHGPQDRGNGAQGTSTLRFKFCGDMQSRQLSLATSRADNPSPLASTTVFKETTKEREGTSVVGAVKAHNFIHFFTIYAQTTLQRPS